ncbi:MAG: orotidine-5'-phosphate decarboxylase [Alphaproteobacteria bacterium]|nr:orotidine-5'-phosphate decarboxylase [Alphaproteobacteria bacterium]
MSGNPVFCSIDTSDAVKAKALAEQLRGHVHGLKLGLEFFLAQGAEGFRAVAAQGAPMFLDLKLHDIPNTVAGAVHSVLPLKPAFLTLHTAGGAGMMRAAAEAAAKAGAARPKLLGVTVLTSLDAQDLASVGQGSDTEQQVTRLAKLAKDSGLDGVVCSPEEVKALRQALGPDFILMVPGIRPQWAAANDQKRFMTPRDAMAAGATYLVIGRPITGADNPAEAAQKIASELAA